MTCTMYCEKIEEIFDAMSQLSHHVLPENRRIVNQYIEVAWQYVGPDAPLPLTTTKSIGLFSGFLPAK